MNRFSNLDGEVHGIEFMDVVPAIQKVTNRYIDPAVDDMYSEAGGGLFAGFKKRREEKQSQKRVTAESKADARRMKAKAKVIAAKGQNKMADTLAKSGDDGSADVLKNLPPLPEEKKSKAPLIIGIVGGVIVLGVIGYVVYKKMHKKK